MTHVVIDCIHIQEHTQASCCLIATRNRQVCHVGMQVQGETLCRVCSRESNIIRGPRQLSYRASRGAPLHFRQGVLKVRPCNKLMLSAVHV